MGEFSVFKGEDCGVNFSAAMRTSAGSNTLKMQAMNCPRRAVVGEEFQIVVQVLNSTNHPIDAQLQCRNPLSGENNSRLLSSGGGGLFRQDGEVSRGGAMGLCVVGLTTTNIGRIDSGETIDVPLSIFAVTAGLHDLTGIVLFDLINKREFYPIDEVICTVLVTDDNSE
jgi:hypothetical protein